MTNLLAHLSEEVLLCDGALGSLFQAADLDPEKDYHGAENCSEILNLTRPDVVLEAHRAYLAAGSDIIQTNSFGGSALTLGEFDLQDQTHEINRRAGELARQAVAELAASHNDGRPRYVLGSVGPGTKLPSLGHVDYDSLKDALRQQAEGLLAGGVDGFIIETVQDLLQLKAAVNAIREAQKNVSADNPGSAELDLPIICTVTIETTGTLLVGSDIAAAATLVDALGLPMLGLNCATGPQEMRSHLTWLAENWPGLLAVQPNAGLPELRDGKPYYPLQPADLAEWVGRFVRETGVNLIGGCCGTTAEHIAALDAVLRTQGSRRPKPTKRQPQWVPGVASLYSASAYRQENAFLSIGERCNANGSKKFRNLQADQDWDGCVAIARDQVREGSHALDICTAFVGRDEVADMTALVSRLRGAAASALVIDSTELPVLAAALKLYGGKPIINSINFEDGEEPAAARLALAREHGAGMVALTIDEEGMAKDAKSKLAIAHRLHDFAVGQHGLKSQDLLIDPLTFTICTGNEDDRKLALETLDAIEDLRRELPECQVILGLSNVSFGLKPAARHVLNSVFLDHALKRGMTGAILHMSKIMPLHTIPPDEAKAAEDLIYDRRGPDYDPLHAFIALFEDRTAAAVEKVLPQEIEPRLSQRIIDGDRVGLNEDLDEALGSYAALDIINNFLLGGMKVVGELFGSGQMQLPFVLQSAETMKAAVSYLEPHMEKSAGMSKGTIILATVKGDVHDIGKNLVDIILTNNGYNVVNLGIKQPIDNIIAAVREHDADVIGMSGLLVKSTVIMRNNLEELSAAGIDIPVLLGGAALTRRYVETDCLDAHAPARVAYARDAFEGLDLVGRAVAGEFDDLVAERTALRKSKPERKSKSARRNGEAISDDGVLRPHDGEEIKLRREELHRDVGVPTPPFWGAKLLQDVSLDELRPLLNERMLYQFHWGFRKQGRRLDDYMDWAAKEVRPILDELYVKVAKEQILQPVAAYGYWPATAEGDDLVLFDHDSDAEVARFSLPRQKRQGGLCIADFMRDADSGERDVIGLQVVTVGQQASDVARQWFEADRYKDYLYLHGLGVEMAEAMAEFVHRRIRAELQFAGEDADDIPEMLRQGYRGARYSFGYPACPNLADQRQILDLLGAGRIGIDLSDEDQLHPEQSTSAIVLHHPQARYFSV